MKYLYKHRGALSLAPSTATNGDVNTNVKQRHWSALYGHAEIGGVRPGASWTGVTVCVTCNKVEHFTNDWRKPEKQYVKEIALCFPSGQLLLLADCEPRGLQASFYGKWCSVLGKQRKHCTETVTTTKREATVLQAQMSRCEQGLTCWIHLPYTYCSERMPRKWLGLSQS